MRIFQYVLQATTVIKIEDKRNEILTNNYFVKIFQKEQLVKEEEYKELSEENKIIETQKKYLVESDNNYRIELLVKIKDREYVLNSQKFGNNRIKREQKALIV